MSPPAVYCGPWAIAEYMGVAAAGVAAEAGAMLGRRVVGMQVREVARYISRKLGRPVDIAWPRRPLPTLAGWAARAGVLPAPCIVTVTGHYVLYRNGMVYDSRAINGVPPARHWCARKRVWAIMRVS